MQPEDIIKLLESNNVIDRRNGIGAYFELLLPEKDEENSNAAKTKNDTGSFIHTRLWKTIRRRTWDDKVADDIIMEFFNYVMRRFKTNNREDLSEKERAKEKDAPKIQNLEAFAFWKCILLITDYERKIGKQKETEVGTEKYIDNVAATVDDDISKLIEECISVKLMKFGKEVSPDGAEAIAMQLNGLSIKQIANWQKRKESAQKEFIRASKAKAASYLEPCNKIGTYSNSVKKLRQK